MTFPLIPEYPYVPGACVWLFVFVIRRNYSVINIYQICSLRYEPDGCKTHHCCYNWQIVKFLHLVVNQIHMALRTIRQPLLGNKQKRLVGRRATKKMTLPLHKNFGFKHTYIPQEITNRLRKKAKFGISCIFW